MYKVFNNSEFFLITFDRLKAVLDSSNIMYPLTINKDVYAITNIQTGSFYHEGCLHRYKIVFIKGLLSSRNDKYPIEYLTIPEFVLFEQLGILL